MDFKRIGRRILLKICQSVRLISPGVSCCLMEIVLLLDTSEGMTAMKVEPFGILIRNNKGIKGVKICDSNILVDNNGILSLPLFAASFRDSPNPEIPPSSVSPEEVDMYLEKMLHGGE